MSLKDRLENQTKNIVNIEHPKEKEPKYYETSDIAQGINTLGEIDTLFADDEINSISVMGAKNVYIERKGKKSKISLTYRDNTRLENIIRKNAQTHGIEIDEKYPYIEFNYDKGINVFATLPPLSSSAAMIIKCYKDKFASLKTLTELQILSREVSLLIEALASLKLNIVIAGAKNTLKTTLLSAIAKKLPQNHCGVVFDYSNELKIENSNITTYDFKNYKNDKLIKAIMLSNPDKVFLNDCPDLSYFEKCIENGYRGICATYCAENPLDVLQNIYLKKADVVIFTERKESKRLVSSISLVNGSELENIFYLNSNFEHVSSGIVPEFYDSIEQNNLQLSSAIFDANYKHTYFKTASDDAIAAALKKNINTEILKKFKKELEVKKSSPAQEENSESKSDETPLNIEETVSKNENEQNL